MNLYRKIISLLICAIFLAEMPIWVVPKPSLIAPRQWLNHENQTAYVLPSLGDTDADTVQDQHHSDLGEKETEKKGITRRGMLKGSASLIVWGLLKPLESLGRQEQVVSPLSPVPVASQELIQKGQVTDVLGQIWNDPEDPRIRSAQATRAMTQALINSKPRFLTKDRKSTVLYPGSGSHVTPLEIASQLIRENRIDEATFIFTEIDPMALDDLRDILQTLVGVGMYTDLQETQQEFPLGQGREVTFRVKFQGKPITVLFALNRSGERDKKRPEYNNLSWGRYWRSEYAQRANLVYHHDLDPPIHQFFPELWNDFYGDGKDRGELFVMSENFQTDGVLIQDRTTGERKRLGLLSWDRVGTVTMVPHGFGHRARNPELEALRPELQTHEERGEYKFNHANLVRFDGSILRGLTLNEYSVVTDFLMIVAAETFDPRLWKNSARDSSNADKWLIDLIQGVQTIASRHIQPASDSHAQWILSLIRFYWVYFNQSGQTLPFGSWLGLQSRWLSKQLPVVFDKLPVFIESADRSLTWQQAVADYLIMNTAGVEDLKMGVTTREWIYNHLSDELKFTYREGINDPDLLAQIPKLGIVTLLNFVRQMGRFGTIRFDNNAKETLKNLPDNPALKIPDADRQRLYEEVQKALESLKAIEQEVNQRPKAPPKGRLQQNQRKKAMSVPLLFQTHAPDPGHLSPTLETAL